MMSKKDGGPAFPSTLQPTSGMTLRDWFAGQALAGLVADPNTRGWETENMPGKAEFCYELADAMIKEREKDA